MEATERKFINFAMGLVQREVSLMDRLDQRGCDEEPDIMDPKENAEVGPVDVDRIPKQTCNRAQSFAEQLVLVTRQARADEKAQREQKRRALDVEEVGRVMRTWIQI